MEIRGAIPLVLLFVGIIACLFLTANVAALDVTLIQSNLSHQVSAQEVSTVNDLFNKNNLNLSNFQITDFNVRTELANNPEATYYTIRLNQIYKGLPVFFENFIYGFNVSGAKVYGLDRRLITNNGRDISITPSITKEAAAQKAVSEYPNKFSEDKLTAELGLYNKNIGDGQETEYFLVWKIGVRDSEYPYAIVSATSNEVLYFDDGVRTQTGGVARSCVSEGKMCGGIAGLMCCEGLVCSGEDSGIADAAGVCVNPTKVPNSNKNLTYYIIGGLVVVVIILIVLLLKKRKTS